MATLKSEVGQVIEKIGGLSTEERETIVGEILDVIDRSCYYEPAAWLLDFSLIREFEPSGNCCRIYYNPTHIPVKSREHYKSHKDSRCYSVRRYMDRFLRKDETIEKFNERIEARVKEKLQEIETAKRMYYKNKNAIIETV